MLGLSKRTNVCLAIIIILMIILVRAGMSISYRSEYNAMLEKNEVNSFTTSLKEKFKNINSVDVGVIPGCVEVNISVNKQSTLQDNFDIFKFVKPILESGKIEKKNNTLKTYDNEIYIKDNSSSSDYDRFVSSYDKGVYTWKYDLNASNPSWHTFKTRKLFYEDTGVLLDNIFNYTIKYNFNEYGKKAYYTYTKNTNSLIYSVYSNINADDVQFTGTKDEMFANEFLVNKNSESRAIFSNSMKFTVSLPIDDEDIKIISFDNKNLKVLSNEIIEIPNGKSKFYRKNFDFQFQEIKGIKNSYVKFQYTPKTGYPYTITIRF
jgi:hypothetical protein